MLSYVTGFITVTYEAGSGAKLFHKLGNKTQNLRDLESK